MQAEVRCPYCNNDFKIDYIEDDFKFHGKNAKCPICENVLWIRIEIKAEFPLVLIGGVKNKNSLKKGGGRFKECDEI